VAAIFTPNSFAAKTDFIVGNQPNGVAAADFDGDGKPDIAVAIDYYAQVPVYCNTSIPGAVSFIITIHEINYYLKPALIINTNLSVCWQPSQKQPAETTRNAVSIVLSSAIHCH